MIGRVYKIEIGENIYIGSTKQKLKERQLQHNNRLQQNIRKNKLYEKCRENNITEIICIPLEDKEIENELEIKILEQEYIEKLNPSLNHNASHRPEEYSKEFKKEYSKEYGKEYRENNKEKYKEYRKEYYENNKEKMNQQCKEYNKDNKDIISKKKKEYYKNIKDKLQEKINCPICNNIVNRSNLTRHQKTKICLYGRKN